jgi:DTW domain-containing protein YfiP
MSRNYCTLCHRPEVACICGCIYRQQNNVHVVILQHPSEVRKSKGSVDLLALSLHSCQVIIGEKFDDCAVFQSVLAQYKDHIALLYPSDQALVIDTSKNVSAKSSIKCLILLDGTWKKAYRLYMINKMLHKLPHIALSAEIKGHYLIRKTNKSAALSTLEACCHALAVIDNEPAKYQQIIEGFIQFNQQYLLFVNSK